MLFFLSFISPFLSHFFFLFLHYVQIKISVGSLLIFVSRLNRIIFHFLFVSFFKKRLKFETKKCSNWMFAKLSCFPTEPDLCQKNVFVVVFLGQYVGKKNYCCLCFAITPHSHVFADGDANCWVYLVKSCILKWTESRNTKTNWWIKWFLFFWFFASWFIFRRKVVLSTNVLTSEVERYLS
jgi:hypothetical protein